jgi:hypothetical protein
LFNSAIAEVVDMLPPELLLKYAIDPIDLSNSPTSWEHDGTAGGPKGKKVLLVLRRESSGGVRRECRVVSLQEYYRTLDTGSIYLATKHTPIYSYTSNGGNTGISLHPLPTADETARIYYFTYPITDVLTSATSISGVPNEAEQAIVLKACIKLLQAYISDYVQDEEDTEMQNMLLSQQKTLEQQYQSEMIRYTEQDATPRGE